jgi:hypothetical protein
LSKGGSHEPQRIRSGQFSMNVASGFLAGNAYFLRWGVVQISLANLLVIAVMVALFVLALLLPFPHAQSAAIDDAPRGLTDDDQLSD